MNWFHISGLLAFNRLAEGSQCGLVSSLEAEEIPCKTLPTHQVGMKLTFILGSALYLRVSQRPKWFWATKNPRPIRSGV